MNPSHIARALRGVILALTLCALALPAVAQDASPSAPAAAPPASPAVSAPPSVAPAASVAPLTRAGFHDAMRKLWEDHITWTRLFIVSKATLDRDLPDLRATTRRLLADQDALGDAIKPFYGDAAGDQLTTLLREHIQTAADLVTAAKDGRKKAIRQASDAWYANADQIATFLNSANPDNWPLDEMQAMMKSHLDLTLAEATAQIDGRWRDSVKAYDAVHDQILTMADMLSDGIIAQFPDQFPS